jgi:hypothetical protein
MKRKPVSPKFASRPTEMEFERLLRLASTSAARVKATPQRVAVVRKIRTASD